MKSEEWGKGVRNGGEEGGRKGVVLDSKTLSLRKQDQKYWFPFPLPSLSPHPPPTWSSPHPPKVKTRSAGLF
jgi:hypothetical protein